MSGQFPAFNQNPSYMQQEQQNQRHHIARLQQVIFELENHVAGLHNNLAYLGRNMRTQNDTVQYVNLLLELNQKLPTLEGYRANLVQMIAMANISYSGTTIPDQCKREIYHLYHAGRYTQDQLARHYGCSQSAVNKIVNGPAPTPV